MPERFGRSMVGSRGEASSGPAQLGGALATGYPLGCVLCTIRGYTFTSDAILVHRLLWTTSLPRAGLESAHVEPDAMRGSLRTFGNGGAFSFSGFYYNKPLGSFRAFVTDPRRSVVLSYASRRIVISPATPENFVYDLGLPTP